MDNKILEEISNCIANIEFGRISGLVKDALAAGIPPYQVVMEGMSKGMDVVGKRYEIKEYFLTELLGAGEIMKEGMEELAPFLGDTWGHAGKVVIGTVRGDLHDIGKNIVQMLLVSAGFEVFDLGVDVSPEKFSEKVKETDANIVAVSALLTVTMPEMKAVIQELDKAGLRGKVKVLIGGSPVTPEFGKEIGADYAAQDAADGVRMCRQWMGKVDLNE